ncbi:MAG: hypothetical protein AB9842_11210 [Bacteroidales bacterium]
MEPTNPGSLIPIPHAKQSKRLGLWSLVLAWLYGVPGIITGIMALKKAKMAVNIYTSNPELYEPSSLNDIMMARLTAVIGLIFSGLSVFYFTSMILFQGNIFSL